MDGNRQIARSGRAFVAHPPPVPTPRGTGEPPLPSLTHQAAGLVRSAVAVALSGVALRTEAEQAACLACCAACDHFRPSDGRCGRMDGCGCVVKRAVRFRAKRCPLNRWPVADPAPGTESADAPTPDVPA